MALEDRGMKTIVFLLMAVGTLFLTVGCEEEHEHHHGGYGGTYDGTYQGYGHGEYRGYPNYGGYPDGTYVYPYHR